jgi:hypothetical protein
MNQIFSYFPVLEDLKTENDSIYSHFSGRHAKNIWSIHGHEIQSSKNKSRNSVIIVPERKECIGTLLHTYHANNGSKLLFSITEQLRF